MQHCAVQTKLAIQPQQKTFRTAEVFASAIIFRERLVRADWPPFPFLGCTMNLKPSQMQQHCCACRILLYYAHMQATLLWLTTNYWALRGKQATFVVGPDFSVVGSDSAAELAGQVAPLEPQLHPLQLVPQRAHAPRIVTQHTQNLPACQRSILRVLPLCMLRILPLSIAPALSISTKFASCHSALSLHDH